MYVCMYVLTHGGSVVGAGKDKGLHTVLVESCERFTFDSLVGALSMSQTT